MPSILKTKERRVLRYLNKYGFTNIKLTIYIMNNSVSLEEVVELEQYFIDSLNPNLNVDLVASKIKIYLSRIDKKGLHTGNPKVPVMRYLNADLQKKQIKLEAKGKAGIYR